MRKPTPIILGELVKKFEVELDGDPSIELLGCAPLDIAKSENISFLVNPIYRQQAITSQTGALIVNKSDYEFVKETSGSSKSYLISQNPYALFARVAQYFEEINKVSENAKRV